MNKIFAAFSDNQHSKCVRWVFDILSDIWSVKIEIIPIDNFLTSYINKFSPNTFLIYYGSDDISSYMKTLLYLHILPSGFLEKKWWEEHSAENGFEEYPVMPKLENYGDIPFPFVLKESLNEKKNMPKNNVSIIKADVISSIFFLVSRFEEYLPFIKDVHGRFSSENSWMAKNGLLEWPIVNEWAEWLWKKIVFLQPKFSSYRKNPENNFRVFLSHDVDVIKKYGIKKTASNILRKNELKKGVKSIINSNHDPYNTFLQFIDWEEEFNFKSVFLFIAGSMHRFDRSYSLTSRAVKQIIQIILDKKFEIGLHGSYFSGDNPQHILREAVKLKNVTKNNNLRFIRQHYLRIKMPDTYLAQSKAGLQFDSTLAFADKTGFRAGICSPFKPINLLAPVDVINITEIPLTIMDATLKFYEKLDADEAFDKIINYAKIVKKHGGVFSLLWHNSSLDPELWKGWESIYYKILKKLAELNPKDFLLD